MPTIHIEAQVSPHELLKAVGQLEPADLEQFVSQVLALRVQQESPAPLPSEAELLRRVALALPSEVERRYRELIAKRKAESLSPNEYAELLRLTDEVEMHEMNRLQALVQLAHLRKTSLTALMEDLHIQVPAHE